MKHIFTLTLILTFALSAYARKGEDDYVETNAAEVCTIPLPVFGSGKLNNLILGTKHVYLRINGFTYGTPMANNGSYFGGDADLITNDLYSDRNLEKEEHCYPVRRKVNDTDERFNRRLECIATAMASPHRASRILPPKSWFPQFRYSFLNNNCGSMANYLLECAGGKASKKSNFAVGDNVPAKKKAKMISLATNESEDSTYGEVCERALFDCDPINGDGLGNQ